MKQPVMTHGKSPETPGFFDRFSPCGGRYPDSNPTPPERRANFVGADFESPKGSASDRGCW